ncbi:hypothetical protein SCACP_40820 [Sporomusa carbonis]
MIELAKRFDLAIEKKSERTAIIIDNNGQEFAIVVDVVTEAKRLRGDCIETIQSAMASKNEYIRGVGKDNERLIILLDITKLFAASELITIYLPADAEADRPQRLAIYRKFVPIASWTRISSRSRSLPPGGLPEPHWF